MDSQKYTLVPSNRNRRKSSHDYTWILIGVTCTLLLLCFRFRLNIWMPDTKDRQRRHLETVDNNEKCSEGFKFINITGRCYQLNGFAKFEEAVRNCSSQNAHFASINSPIEREAFIQFVKEAKPWPLERFWTGFTYNNQTATWNSPDGTELNFTEWYTDDFSTLPEQYWVAVHYSYFWSELAEHEFHVATVGSPNFFQFICEKPAYTDVAGILENQTASSENSTLVNMTSLPESATTATLNNFIDLGNRTCGEEYTYFNRTGYCYKAGHGKYRYEKQVCKTNENEYLVSIHSEEENEFVIDLAYKTLPKHDARQDELVTIGLIYKNNRWEWSDGTPIDYTAWDSVMPFAFVYGKYRTTSYISPYIDRPGHFWFADLFRGNVRFMCKRLPD